MKQTGFDNMKKNWLKISHFRHCIFFVSSKIFTIVSVDKIISLAQVPVTSSLLLLNNFAAEKIICLSRLHHFFVLPQSRCMQCWGRRFWHAITLRSFDLSTEYWNVCGWNWHSPPGSYFSVKVKNIILTFKLFWKVQFFS
jgi:hypothetical protein